MHCFPSTLAWLVRTVYEVLMNAKTLGGREVNSLCVDLVFNFFICSAVVSPEPHGIVDAPISHISRFNLIQVSGTHLLLHPRVGVGGGKNAPGEGPILGPGFFFPFLLSL